jgi:CRP-like cAMP-binding protein
MARHTCPSRTVLFAQGTMPSAVFWLEEGLVKLACAGADGHEMTVRLHGPGWLGAPAALLDRPYSATATTLTPSTVLRLPAAEFRRLAHTDLAFAGRLNELLSRDLEGYVVQLSEIGRLPARQRLEMFLTDQALVWGIPRSDGSCRLTIPFSHREIADVLAVAPEHLSRLLKHLEERGFLRRSKGSFLLRRPGHPPRGCLGEMSMTG